MKSRHLWLASMFGTCAVILLAQAPPRPQERLIPVRIPPSMRQLPPEELGPREADHQAATTSIAPEQHAIGEEPDDQRIGVPPTPGCKRRLRISGRPDNFNPNNPEPRFQSPALQSFMQGKAQKGFDALSWDSLFGVSFPLGVCKLCGPERFPVFVDMMVRRKNTGGMTANDTIYIYLTNGNTPAGQMGTAVQTIQPWQGPFATQTQRNVQFQIPTGLVNQHIWSSPGPAFLDVVMQDDTGIDYVRLITLSF